MDTELDTPAEASAGRTELSGFFVRWWKVIIPLVVVAIAVGVTAIALGAGSDDTDLEANGRPLTERESQRLAVAQFRNYQATGIGFTLVVPDPQKPVTLTGKVDFRAGAGYATTGTTVLQWNRTSVVTWAIDAATIPSALPTVEPTVRTIAPSASAVDAVLVLLLSLEADKPQEAAELRFSDAMWLRSDTVDGIPVEVFGGPSTVDSAIGSAGTQRVRYWIDLDGVLWRFEADLPTGTVTVTLDHAAFETFLPAPELN